MDYQAQLTFLRQLLKDMNISSCVANRPSSHISPEIDLGLRSDLFGLDNYAPFLQNSMGQAQDNTLYRFCDEYQCSYIFLRLPEDDCYFFIGPYLLTSPSAAWLAQKGDSLGLNNDQLQRMKLYYTRLPLIEDENFLISMANTLAKHLWGSPERYVLEYVDYAIHDRYEPIPLSTTSEFPKEHPQNLTILEANYASENQLIDAVSKGKLNLVTAVASTIFNNGAEPRLPDSLRDRKNNLIILKTLLRKAAEYGDVHPLHIHRLSTHFAAQIEQIHSVKESFALQEEMIRSYCQLVKRHSLRNYSYYVGKAITLIQYDLTADLRLATIASQINVNSSYLSSLFHKECGCTLTEYITKQRMDHALLLLQVSGKTIQEIAHECGIQDVNYFIKLFKKYTGFTPNHYREQFGKAGKPL